MDIKTIPSCSSRLPKHMVKEMIEMNEEFLTVKNVAEKLGIKAVTCYKWIREGKLKGTYLKLGGVYRFSKQLLEKHLEDMMSND